MISKWAKLLLLLAAVLTTTACSMGKITVRASLPLVEGGVEALNRETDLTLAETAIAANLALLEGMLVQDPGNRKLHAYGAQAYYGYAYGFVEDSDKERASDLYYRGIQHGFQALSTLGLKIDPESITVDTLKTETAKLKNNAVAALFWTASNWAKWADMNRDDPVAAAHLPKAVVLMERVMELDENFYFAGPHMFFGVYYGARPAMIGGDPEKSRMHFDRARELTGNKLLLVDLLQAEYLSRQLYEQQDFHDRLTGILNAPDNLFPEIAIANAIAKRKAACLLEKESEWF